MLKRMWREDEGVLTFEWVLLVTLLVIGTVGAMSSVRDAINSELSDVAVAMVSLDQSYVIADPVDSDIAGATISCAQDGAVGSSFQDEALFTVDRAKPGQNHHQTVGPANCP